jgi:RNA polymerase sigma factor (sigma-70 family)
LNAGEKGEREREKFSASAACISARRKLAARHGGGQSREDIAGLEIAPPSSDDELLSVHQALEKFSAVDQPKAKLVKLRYFAGLPFSEVAEVLGISEPTTKRWWAYARAWLHAEIKAL